MLLGICFFCWYVNWEVLICIIGWTIISVQGIVNLLVEDHSISTHYYFPKPWNTLFVATCIVLSKNLFGRFGIYLIGGFF